VHVAERQHVLKSVFPPVVESAAAAKLGRVLKRPEQNVPDRQIREIIRVVTELMMHTMRFRTLKHESKPARSLDVPMIEELTNRYKDRVIPSSFDVAADQRIHNEAAARQSPVRT